MRKVRGLRSFSYVLLAVLATFFFGYVLFSPHGMVYKKSQTHHSLTDLAKTLSPTSPSSMISESANDFSQRRVIQPLLHQQGLSHMIFHNGTFQALLASILPSEFPRSVLVAGVEWGGDVKQFAKLGYRVIAFEPLTLYFENVEKYFQTPQSVRDDGKPADVMLFNTAVGNESGTLELNYRGMKYSVPIVRIDDKVNEPVSLLMADVQGNELSVLLGALRLLKSSVQMVWVEAISCNPKLPALLNLLDEENFIVFDFAPFGRPPGQDLNIKPREKENFVFNPDRLSQFDKYLEWFCTLKTNFSMLQTDFVAIRRTLHPIATSRLMNVSSMACQSENPACVLRSHLRSVFT